MELREAHSRKTGKEPAMKKGNERAWCGELGSDGKEKMRACESEERMGEAEAEGRPPAGLLDTPMDGVNLSVETSASEYRPFELWTVRELLLNYSTS